MQKPTDIYLVRHGQAECNRDGYITGGGGRMDESPLTESGRQQAAALRDKLRDVPFAAAFSSDLCRAAETAEIIAGGKLPVQKLAALRERDFGELEGQPDTALKPLLAASERLTPTEKWRTPLRPDVESDAHIYQRVLPVVTQAAKQYASKQILIVAHGGPIRTLLIGQGLITEAELPLGSFQHGGYAHLRWAHRKLTLVSSTGIDKTNRTNE